MENVKKLSMVLVALGFISLGGCEVYEAPPPYHSYYNDSTVYAPVGYGAYPYPYYGYGYGPYYGPHRRHWR